MGISIELGLRRTLVRPVLYAAKQPYRYIEFELHTYVFVSLKMLLPNADKATIESEKILDYVLSFDHFEGKNKARVFASVLGLMKTDSEYLITAIKEAILITEAVEQSESGFGTKFTVDFDLTLMIKLHY